MRVLNCISKYLSKYSDMDVVLKAGVWFVFCNIVQQGISIITTPVFTRIMTEEEYGIFSVYRTWYNVLVVAITLELVYAPFTNAMVKFEDKKNDFVSSMQSFFVISSVIWIVIFIVFQNFFTELMELPPIALYLMIIHVFTYASMSLWVAKQRFEYHYKKVVGITLSYALLNTALGIVLVLFMENGWFARILSMVISQGILGIILFFINIGNPLKVSPFKYWKYGIRFGGELLPNSLASLLLDQADRIVIQKMCGETDVAFYSLAYSIATMVNLFKTAITNSFLPWYYRMLKAGEEENVRKRISNLLFLMMFIVSGALLVMPEIVAVMGGNKYAGAINAIPPITISVFYMFLGTMCINTQYYFDKLLFGSITSVVSIVLNFSLNVVFVEKYGYIAAGYTTLVSYAVISISRYLYSLHLLKKLKRDKLFNNKVVLGLCVYSVILLPCCLLLYQYPVVRYGIIFILILLLIVFHKQVEFFIKKYLKNEKQVKDKIGKDVSV